MLREFWALPLSWIFGSLVALKNALYDRGIKKVDRLDAPVISVGNLSMGGTGKSPVTADLVGRLLEQGLQPAVLSRGYGRRNPKQAHRVDPDGDWRDYGDEPSMIARRHREAVVCVGPSRYQAAQPAGKVDVYVVDDGFQHRQLHRDADLVLLDVTKGLPKLFPRALFREPLASLKRAHGVLLTRWDGKSDLTPWCDAVHAVKPGLPILKLRYGNPRLLGLDGVPLDPATYQDQPVASYAGIAHPQPFFDSLAAMGLPPRHTLALGDHEIFAGHRADAFQKQCAADGVQLIITTEKDAVKLEKTMDYAIIIAFLAIDILWEDPAQIDTVLRRITGK